MISDTVAACSNNKADLKKLKDYEYKVYKQFHKIVL
jgi:hypothetical protein